MCDECGKEIDIDINGGSLEDGTTALLKAFVLGDQGALYRQFTGIDELLPEEVQKAVKQGESDAIMRFIANLHPIEAAMIRDNLSRFERYQKQIVRQVTELVMKGHGKND